MSEEELIETLRTFEKNRVEQLEEPARNLFYAIMKIANERDRLNNIIKEAIEYIEKNTRKEKSTFYGFPDCEIFDGNIKDILKILKGSEKE